MSKTDRRKDILNKARMLIAARGYAGTEMEDIRLECQLSRGGLYHHFGNKRAVLDALIEEEVLGLVRVIDESEVWPIAVLLDFGSSHLGNDPGIVADLNAQEERLDYLSSLEVAFDRHLTLVLGKKMQEHVLPEFDAGHVSELFVTVNAHINRRQILGDWTEEQAAGFAATALQALVPFLKDPTQLHATIAELKKVSTS
ncbi:TetR/AcrR family transcriptional regulator [Maritalea myrionectae]|uniref:TetR/AcrR family transcriptional regulator n=1 Tax=Maritalea myrionectae TaxID=454601 RepID=UPI0013C2F8FD|nr:TetR/AcrR family transcriptional regulator [Maritalea myrionectae]